MTLKYCGKLISQLTDDELRDAIRNVAGIDLNRQDRLAQAGTRHKKLFNNYPAKENPNFTILAEALNTEFKNRELTNA